MAAAVGAAPIIAFQLKYGFVDDLLKMTVGLAAIVFVIQAQRLTADLGFRGMQRFADRVGELYGLYPMRWEDGCWPGLRISE